MARVRIQDRLASWRSRSDRIRHYVPPPQPEYRGFPGQQMKQHPFLLAIAVTLMLAGCVHRGPAVVNYETAGNLASTRALGCVGPHGVSSRDTPADLMRAMTQCVQQSNYHNALFLYALSGVYSHFDVLRVSDRTAHDAGGVLLLQAIQSMTAAQRIHLQNEIRRVFGNRRKTAIVCREVEHIGPPNYYPAYMINHGMNAFASASGSGLTTNFNPVSAWDEVLASYLHCSGT